jgi:hypothetical protein
MWGQIVERREREGVEHAARDLSIGGRRGGESG